VFQDLFAQIFGGGGRQAGPRKTKDLVHRVNVSLEDLYKGKTTKLSLSGSIICAKCQKKGGKDGAVRQCPTCSGRGVKLTLRQMGPTFHSLVNMDLEHFLVGNNLFPFTV
jgi:DnaJ family protein A protein 2